uniref:C1q domain protein n=1 Tax=Marseillevirus LCMAC102 TaxID=2506603 RepID=A0A481YSP4_9VIRU|nr:MAG: C1q domain protein [Marseillevirus LCMAC102]
MNKPNQVVPSFVSVYLVANQTLGANYEIVLFDIIETDGTNTSIYDRTTGEFTAPCSGWYNLEVQLTTDVTLTGLRIIRNGDTNFPPIARIPADVSADLTLRCKLGAGETLRVEADTSAGADVLALAGTTPDARTSNAIFTLVKRFDDTKTF